MTSPPAPTRRSAGTRLPAAPRRSGAPRRSALADRRLRELAFLHEFAQLATQARDWDELMRTIVDRTTEALGVEVCSFYLADREGHRLTLAATNGLDRSQVGEVSLAFGEGITGLAARRRRPVNVPDVTADPRFRWVRGFDIAGLHAMLSMPLVWHDQVVGVLNVQAEAVRRFSAAEVSFLTTIAALLAGIIEKGRLQAEVEARLASLTALDAARAELLSVVTHELRTPLAVVRAYVDLLSEAAAPATDESPEWHAAAIDQLSRLDRLVDSILASVRGEGLTGLAREPFDAVAAVDETVETLRLLLRPHPIRWAPPAERLVARGDAVRFRQVLEQLLENEAKYAPPGDGVSIGAWREGPEVRVYVTDDGPGIPIADWEAVFEPFVRITGGGGGGAGGGGHGAGGGGVASLPSSRSSRSSRSLPASRSSRSSSSPAPGPAPGGGAARGSGIGLFAARRLMNAMGGRVWLEPNGYGGSRFVVALPGVG